MSVKSREKVLGELLTAAGGNIPNPLHFPRLRVYQTGAHRELAPFRGHTISRDEIIRNAEDMVICVRSSRPMEQYIRKLSEKRDLSGAPLVCSMWDGYLEGDAARESSVSFARFCKEEMGMRMIRLHTSGHADKEAILQLMEHVHADHIVPVHTKVPDAVRELYHAAGTHG